MPPRENRRIESLFVYFFVFHFILLREYHSSTHFSLACVHSGQERAFLGLAYKPAFPLDSSAFCLGRVCNVFM